MPKAMVRAWLDAARETDAVEGVNEEVRRARALALAIFAPRLCACSRPDFLLELQLVQEDVMSEASQV